jgi:uncharacterized protein YndB with AHSA1/START domain
MDTKSNNSDNNRNGTVITEGNYTTLKFERHIAHSKETIWKAITEPKELASWFNAKAKIDGRNGGTIDYISAPAGFHTTGQIIIWDPPCIFEHEWHIEPHPPEMPNGEMEAVIRWKLVYNEENKTKLSLTFSRLTKPTGYGFAPGMHAFLDRLESHLDHEELPNWMDRYAKVKGSYPAWQS